MKKLLFALFFVLAFGISTVFAASDVTLEWDANTEADLAGYKMYYGTSLGGPYSGTGALEGNSPIDVGNVTIYTLHGLADGATYFVVTAYDMGELESDYSNEVSAVLDTEAPAAPQNCIIKIIMKILE